MLRFRYVAVALGLGFGTLTQDAGGAAVTSLMTQELRDFAGKEALMLVVEYPPGGVDAPHRHDAHAFIYVLEGSVVMQVNDDPEVTLNPGQAFYEEPGDVHTVARNASQTQPAKFLVLFLKDKGAEFLLPAKEPAQPSTGIKRTDLQREDLGTHGREAIQVLVEFAPGTAFPAHSHPGEELVYVTEGSLEYAVEDRPPVTLDAGDTLFIPAGAVHAVRNVGKGNGAELATYIVEKGKPLLVLAE